MTEPVDMEARLGDDELGSYGIDQWIYDGKKILS